jgi:hypothetical protein
MQAEIFSLEVYKNLCSVGPGLLKGRGSMLKIDALVCFVLFLLIVVITLHILLDL